MKRGYADTRWGQIHYVSDGTGAPLILLGPAGRSSRVHAALIPLLAGRYRVVAPDMLGFGSSDPLPEGATIETLAESIVDLLTVIKTPRAHVYGLHTGNKIAAALAARRSDCVDKLVLCGQTHSLIPEQKRRNEVILGLVHGYFAHGEANGVPNRALEGWAATYRDVAALWWDKTLFVAGDTAASIERTRQRVLDEIQACGSTAAIYEANFAYDLGADLRRIESQTLIVEVVTPGEDRTIGRQGERLTKIIRNSTLITLDEPLDTVVTLENRAVELSGILISFLG